MSIDEDYKSILALLWSRYSPNQQLAEQLAAATGIDLQPFWEALGELHDWEYGLDTTNKSWSAKEKIEKRLALDKPYLLANFHNQQTRFSHYKGAAFPTLLLECHSFEQLSFYNSLTPSLHPSISLVKGLKRLSLAYTCIVRLPDSICDLSDLKELTAEYSFLESLPDNFGNLAALQTCCLRGNRLRRLPDSFVRLQQLHTLDLRENYDMDWAQVFSIVLKMPNIKWLGWGNNIKMTTISTITILDLSHYMARLHIAEDKFWMTHWASFSIRPKLPSWDNMLRMAAQFPLLHTLRLSNCELDFLPTSIGILKKIRHLYLSDNYLKTLPDEISELKNLESLYLANNLFDEVPTVLLQLPRLQQLNITGNNIREIPTWLSEGLPELKVRLRIKT